MKNKVYRNGWLMKFFVFLGEGMTSYIFFRKELLWIVMAQYGNSLEIKDFMEDGILISCFFISLLTLQNEKLFLPVGKISCSKLMQWNMVPVIDVFKSLQLSLLSHLETAAFRVQLIGPED